MSQTFEAVFDGSVLKPDGEIDLEPNTRVKVSVEVLPPNQVDGEPGPPEPKRKSFLETARSLKIEGPTDLSENLDKYLYGHLAPQE